jgi:hypothetical protein
MPISSSSKSTKRGRVKPKKPYSSFPLTSHANGQWCKKIRGKLHYYFGQWDDPGTALAQYLNVANDLHAGRKPRVTLPDGRVLVKDVCNH